MKYMALKFCSVFVHTNKSELIRYRHTHSHIHTVHLHQSTDHVVRTILLALLRDRSHLTLETTKCSHILGLFAWDAPVIGLVDRLVVFPG